MASDTTTSSSNQAPQRRTDELLSMLAERVGARFAASTVFGEPVRDGGITVIPVATVRFGLGAGAGSDPAKGQDGEGGGAGGSSAPAGYIELKDGRSRFVPVVHPTRMVGLVGATILAGLLILRPRMAPPVAGVLRRRR